MVYAATWRCAGHAVRSLKRGSSEDAFPVTEEPLTIDRASAASVGRTSYSRNSRVGVENLAVDAIRAAEDDAGSDARDIDGLLTIGLSDTAKAMLDRALGHFGLLPPLEEARADSHGLPWPRNDLQVPLPRCTEQPTQRNSALRKQCISPK